MTKTTTPPYKITSKIPKLSTQISEEHTKLEFVLLNVPKNDSIKYVKVGNNG